MDKPKLLRENDKYIPGEKYLLVEVFGFCKDGVCQRPQLNEFQIQGMQKDSTGLYLKGIIQRADEENGNGRVYPRSILEREVENYKRLIREKRAYGCLDHPDDSVVNLEKTSHMMTEIWWQGNEVWGTLKIMPTPMGKIVENLIEGGGTIGLSSRGLGSVTEQKNGLLKVESDFQLICFDIVSEPSTYGAFMRPVNELKDYSPDLSILRENKLYTKNDRIYRAIGDFFSDE